jgi:hypothetical protein
MILEIVNGVQMLVRSLSNSVLSEGIAQTDIHLTTDGWMRTEFTVHQQSQARFSSLSSWLSKRTHYRA